MRIIYYSYFTVRTCSKKRIFVITWNYVYRVLFTHKQECGNTTIILNLKNRSYVLPIVLCVYWAIQLIIYIFILNICLHTNMRHKTFFMYLCSRCDSEFTVRVKRIYSSTMHLILTPCSHRAIIENIVKPALFVSQRLFLTPFAHILFQLSVNLLFQRLRIKWVNKK